MPRRYAHFLYGVIQSGLTCAVTAGIVTLRAPHPQILQWFASWVLAWLAITPIVLLAAPALRSVCNALTRDDSA